MPAFDNERCVIYIDTCIPNCTCYNKQYILINYFNLHLFIKYCESTF